MNESQEATYPSLKGRVVFITGGGSGIGAAIVRSWYGTRRANAVRNADRTRPLTDSGARPALRLRW